MHTFLYNYLVLPLLLGGLHILKFFIPKIREGLRGRQGWIERARSFAGRRNQVSKQPLLLFHCASAGELEALRPLAGTLKARGFSLALSYFSPSAISAANSATEFDFRDYSPVDTKSAVRKYFELLNPSLIVITKHDVWPNFVWEARARNIPALLINGNFHPKSLRNSALVRSFNRKLYGALSAIYTVSEDDAVRARDLVKNSTSVLVSGDSRFDRVLTRAKQNRTLPGNVEELCRNRFVIVAGSTHEEDERYLLPAFAAIHRHALSPLLLIIPHDPSEQAQTRIMTAAHSLRLTLSENSEADILLLNQSGVLADLYRLGKFAYVGGAFGKGVHSVLEPMANKLPVICGPNFGVASEARAGHKLGIVTSFNTQSELQIVLQTWLDSPEQLARSNEIVSAFMSEHSGVTARLSEVISSHLPRAAAS